MIDMGIATVMDVPWFGVLSDTDNTRESVRIAQQRFPIASLGGAVRTNMLIRGAMEVSMVVGPSRRFVIDMENTLPHRHELQEALENIIKTEPEDDPDPQSVLEATEQYTNSKCPGSVATWPNLKVQILKKRERWYDRIVESAVEFEFYLTVLRRYCPGLLPEVTILEQACMTEILDAAMIVRRFNVSRAEMTRRIERVYATETRHLERIISLTDPSEFFDRVMSSWTFFDKPTWQDRAQAFNRVPERLMDFGAFLAAERLRRERVACVILQPGATPK